jgi:hypothetical protein
MYVEHERVLESLAIGRDPLIPCDGLALFEDVRDVSIEPTLRGRSGKFPEWRLGTPNLEFDECEDGNEERRRKEPKRKQPKHYFLGFERDESQRGELYTDCSIH